MFSYCLRYATVKRFLLTEDVKNLPILKSHEFKLAVCLVQILVCRNSSNFLENTSLIVDLTSRVPQVQA
jgi:hypothetical protein